MLAWFLPPRGSLSVTGPDNRLAFALFVPGTVVGSIVMDGNQWLKRWITSSDRIAKEHTKIGAGGGNRTHGLGIMRPSLYH